jgi:hypothetical protein
LTLGGTIGVLGCGIGVPSGSGSDSGVEALWGGVAGRGKSLIEVDGDLWSVGWCGERPGAFG